MKASSRFSKKWETGQDWGSAGKIGPKAPRTRM